MKFFRIFITLSILAYFLHSCSFILGLKVPEQITEKEVYDYLLKCNIDTSNVIFLKDGYLDTLKKLPFKPGWEPGFRPVQCKIFSKNDDLIFHYSSCEGSLKQTGIYETFPPINLTPIDSTYTFLMEKDIIRKNVPKRDNVDYVAVIYWATYTGIPGRKFLKNVENALKGKNAEILILKLNTDIIHH